MAGRVGSKDSNWMFGRFLRFKNVLKGVKLTGLLEFGFKYKKGQNFGG